MKKRTPYAESVERVRQRKRAVIFAYKKERGCQVCGEMDPVVLDFHHREGTIKNPSLLKRYHTRAFYHLGWGNLFKEMEKCDVLCANCHRREEDRKRRKK